MGMHLFHEESEETEDISKIEINEEFAQRYEHNKKREDLQRFEELKKKGQVKSEEDSSSSESESEEDLMAIDDEEELQFLDALARIKKKDPIIFQKDAKLFESDDESGYSDDDYDDISKSRKKKKKDYDDILKSRKKKKKDKPMYLKDVVAKQLIEEGSEFAEEGGIGSKLSYTEEQEENLREVLRAADEAFRNTNDDDDDGELLKEKKRGKNVEEEKGEDEIFIKKKKKKKEKLDECFSESSDWKEMFFKDFFEKNKWELKKEKHDDDDDHYLIDVSEDEEELEKQDKYEAYYNFRHEEEGIGDRVLGHARFPEEGLVRKKTNTRKLQRKRKEERMAQAKLEMDQEVKRLKNLKNKEFQEQLKEIGDAAGIPKGKDFLVLVKDFLKGDNFDSEKHDRIMEKFNEDKYYEADDPDPDYCGDDNDDGGLGKPDFDKEDELLGLSKGWDEEEYGGSSDGLSAAAKARDNILKSKLEELKEEYYKLDYEGTAGGQPTRFKYASVPPRRYGLTTADVLVTDEKELNQYAPLKKIAATYAEVEWKVSKGKRFNLKMKNTLINGASHSKASVAGDEHQGKHQVNGLNAEVGSTESRRSRRRRRQSELKLPISRLQAYGKIPAKLKSKKKH